MANQYRSVLASSGPAPTGGDALPTEVLSGKTFTNDNGAQTGTMTNNGAVSQTLSAGESYTIPEGYHNGNGTVTAEHDTILAVGTVGNEEVMVFSVGNTVSGSPSSGAITISGYTLQRQQGHSAVTLTAPVACVAHTFGAQRIAETVTIPANTPTNIGGSSVPNAYLSFYLTAN